MPIIVCKPRLLTPSQAATAVRRSIEINPANATEFAALAGTPGDRRGGARRLALVIAHRWPSSGARLTVQFLDNPSAALRARILLHMNAWGQAANVRFEETKGVGMVRIARLEGPPDLAGYWSYIGTEILGIEEDAPTLNLEGFTMRTAESEFKRVVRHEAGHTLGFEHEHMRAELVKKIDKRKAIVYYRREEGWSAKETALQVLSPLSEASLMGTEESDPLSIMCYHIPGQITKDGKAIAGGLDINPKDFAFAASIYPKATAPHHGDMPEPMTPAAPTSPSASMVAPLHGAVRSEADAFHIVVLDPFEPDANAPSTGAARPKFARVFASYGGARVTTAMRLRADRGHPPTRYGRIISAHDRIKKYTNLEQGTLPTDNELIAFGTDLFETLFQGDVRRLYDEARARQQGRKLDLVLTSMIPWIAEKPWEFAYDPTRCSFLATEEIHFIRNVLTAVPADLISPRVGPLRILVAAAQPVGFGRLSVSQEADVIQRGFEALVSAGLAVVEVMPRATPGAIHARLSNGAFDIVHFIGHGVFDETKQEGSLVFEDDQGGTFMLGERSVREIFCQRGIRLVFLNACQTGSGGRADFNKGVAQALVSRGLPALVANQYSVLDSSATSFAQYFYWALAQGTGIGQAAREARIAVNYSMQGEPIDWALPVVYARDPDMTFCPRPETLAAARMTRARGQRRAGPQRQLRVAFWDIDNVFPALDRTLERMNGAQPMIEFGLVDLSAPVDAWDLDVRAPDGKPYLRAERLAHRLASATVELHVNILACMTRHWLRDESTLNLYTWWPDEKKPPVVILSFAGFDDLPVEGEQTDRAIANMVATALAGYLGGMGTHERGARDCPMAFNETRSLAHLTATQKFDSSCRTRLMKKLPNEFAALDALLKARP